MNSGRRPWRFLKRFWEWLVDRPLKAGTQLAGKYVIDRFVGRGSYGLVYLCRSRIYPEKLYILKQAKPSKKWSARGKQAFDNEVAILQTLHHPHLPRFVDRFADKGHSFLVMTYIEGETLEDLLFRDRHTFSEEDALRLLDQITGIVVDLHRCEVAHHDLRVPNVILHAGRPFLIDFGLSRPLRDLDPVEVIREKQRDFEYLGHFLLFLLYSTYEDHGGPEQTWEEELSLSSGTRSLLRRLLRMEEPFQSAEEIREEIQRLLTQRTIQ